MPVDDWRNMSLVRCNFLLSSATDVAGLIVTHTGLAVGQHHMASWAIMSPLGNIVGLPQMVLEVNDVREFVPSRDAAGDEVALGISCYRMDLEHLA